MSTKSTGTRAEKKENADRKPRSEGGGRRPAVARGGSAMSAASALKLSTETPKASATSLYRAEPVQCLVTPAESVLEIEMGAGMELTESIPASPASGSRPVIIEMASDCSDVELPVSGTGIVTGFSARGHLSSQVKDALNTMERRQRPTRSTRSEPLIKKALTQSTTAAAASELKPGAGLEVVSRSPVGSLASVTDDDDWSESDLEGGGSIASGRTSILPSSKTGPTLTMEHAGRRANQLLQTGKQALETAGNMKRECRVAAADSLQQLYEMVLAISDSRSRHKVNLEQEMKRSAREVVRIERQHNKQIADLQKNHSIRIKEIMEKQEATHKVSESVLGWLNFELSDPLKTIGEIHNQLKNIECQLSEASSTHPTDSGERLTKEYKEISEKLGFLRGDVHEVQSSIRAVHRQIQETPLPLATATAVATSEVAVAEEVASGRVDADMSKILEEIKDLKEDVKNSRGSMDVELAAGAIRAELAPIKNQLKEIQKSMRDMREAREVDLATVLMSGQAGGGGVGTEIALTEISGKLETLENALRDGTLVASPATGEDQDVRNQRKMSPTTYREALLRPRYPIVVESVDPLHSSQDVAGSLRKGVDVIGLGIAVSGVKNIKNQKIVVNCESENDRTRLKDAINSSDKKLTVSQPRMRKPMIKLIGVAYDLSDAEIESAIKKQNVKLVSELSEDDTKVKVLRRIKNRSNARTKIIMEVTPALWNRLREQEVRVGYQIVRAMDHSPTIQCYHCLGYGHIARECKSEARCGYCSGKHETRECGSRDGPPNCINCMQIRDGAKNSHPAYSEECPEWEKWDRIARMAINYCC